MFLKNYWYSLSWAAVILVLTLIPGKKLPQTDLIGIDKVVHLLVFGLLMLLLLRDLYRNSKSLFYTYVTHSFILCFLFGLIIEVLQYFIPGRDFSIYDVIANSLGIVIGYFSFKLYLKK